MTYGRTALAIIGTLCGLAVGPKVTLRSDGLDIPVAPDELLAYFQARLADAEDAIVGKDGESLVRRFSGNAGPFPYRTVEVVTFQPDSIVFDHLAGPFSHCHERFQLDAIAFGTRITHTGTFRLRGGLWTAPLALTAVRRAFEEHVHHHLESLAEELTNTSADGQR